MTFVEIKKEDIDIQKKLLYLSIWQSKNQAQIPFNIMNEHHVTPYYKNWGALKNDLGYFAKIDDKIVGLVQLRVGCSSIINNSDLPELIISVVPKLRGVGIGSALIDFIITKNKSSGIRLQVDKENKKAIKLYEKKGFIEYKGKNHSLLYFVFKDLL